MNNYGFYEFYNNLKNKNVFFIFFTSGLLFLLNKTLENISDMNIVLIGSGLNKSEKSWIKERYDLPLFCIDDVIDDRKMWDILFKVCDNNFGWIDIDCFIFNKKLIYKMQSIEPNVAFNTTWVCISDQIPEREFVNTYFLYANKKVYDDINNKLNSKIYPGVYIYENDPPFHFSHYYFISSELQNLINNYIPPESYSFENIFDTMHFYNLIAEINGYKVNKVRKLYDRVNGFDNYFSEDVIHLGQSSRFSMSVRQKNYPTFKLSTFENGPGSYWFLLIIYNLYKKSLGILPSYYTTLFACFKNAFFNKLNLDWDNSENILVEFFKEYNINKYVVEKLINL